MKCRGCGCTDTQACEGGCWWVAPEICSSCSARVQERQIPFSAAMVRAVLDEQAPKTQTRRVVKPQPRGDTAGFLTGLEGEHDRWWPTNGGDYTGPAVRCPYGKPGDRLWVREAWKANSIFNDRPPRDIPTGARVFYLADPGYSPDAARYRHARFMPRWASRITLEVTGVRVERLQEISVSDVAAEGVRIPVDPETGRALLEIGSKFAPAKYLPKPDPMTLTLRSRRAGKTSEFNLHMARAHYASLWETINGEGSWAANPWVWVVEFKRVTP